MQRFAAAFPAAQAVQLVRHLRQEQEVQGLRITATSACLAGLAA